jgi:hypothetical protein
MWTQIVGQVQLAHAPWTNHCWHATLRLTPTGLSTSTIPCSKRTVEIDFDFVNHELKLRTSDGETRGFALESAPVAVFYRRLMRLLEDCGVAADIWTTPVEVEEPDPLRG